MTYGSYMGSWQPSAAGPYTGRRARNSSGAFGLCICTDLDAFYPKTEGLTYGLTDSETDKQPHVGFRSSGPPSVTHIRKAESVLFLMVLPMKNFSPKNFRGEGDLAKNAVFDHFLCHPPLSKVRPHYSANLKAR